MAKKSFSPNVLACLLAGIIGSIVMLRIGKRFVANYIPYPLQIVLVGLYLVGTISFIFIWKFKESKANIDSTKTLAFWQGAIRYFIALDLCMFALQKFFHLQFALPLGVLDNPFSSLSGEEMVWAFFGRFYAFTVIIGGMQILGSLMLLFRKTRLLGVFVLLPILLNILLLDWFYDMTMTVNVYITLLTIALLYLLLVEYGRLVEFFFIAKSNLPQFEFKNPVWKNALRASVIVIPLLVLAIYKFPAHYADIYGKYEVKSNPSIAQNACRDSVLTKVFIDDNDFVMEFDNYRNRYIGNYQYNQAENTIKVIWHYPATMHDTLFAKITTGNGAGTRFLTGRMGKKALTVEMTNTVFEVNSP